MCFIQNEEYRLQEDRRLANPIWTWSSVNLALHDLLFLVTKLKHRKGDGAKSEIAKLSKDEKTMGRKKQFKT